jgi:putative isomerase
MKTVGVFVLLCCFTAVCFGQAVPRNIKTAEYRQLQEKLATGWNTWYNNSIMSHVHLPEGFSINLCLSHNDQFLREIFKASKASGREEAVTLGLRADDGSFTSLKVKYKDEETEVQSATDGEDIVILVTPARPGENQLVVEAGIVSNKPGITGAKNQQLTGQFGSRNFVVSTTAKTIENAYLVTSAPHIAIPLKGEIGIYSGKERTLQEIKELIALRRAEQQKRVDSYGNLSEQFKAMQTILAWNTIYDAPNHRVISPVSRNWNKGWGGFVLFDWDTYFASYMCSLFNKDLAYVNAVEITKAITPQGFIPNYQSPFGQWSWDRSQPPIGSTVILQIYNRYHEKWFLEEVYGELLSWNRWWEKNREIDGYLAWGSNWVPDSLRTLAKHNIEAAKLESGLDNSPMYDDIPFDQEKNVMKLADVGLMSFYIMDCNSMITISEILGKKAEAIEIGKRAEKYKKQLATLWDEKTGIFLNKRLDTGEFSHRLSPTNFYPMLAKACTQQQAETMMKKHYFNPEEFYGEFVIPSIMRNDPAFKDNDYWRGRIWAPMNFLVYMGMCNYKVPEAKADLVKRSNALLMKSWKEDGSIYENYNGATGQGNDVGSADGFYHWGALLTFMSFIENGYMAPNK